MALSQKEKTTLIILTVAAVVMVVATIYLTVNSPYKEEYVVNNSILVLYTGGTIGMVPTPEGLVPQPGMLQQALAQVTQGNEDRVGRYEVREIDPLLDSSNMTPSDWIKIAMEIEQVYNQYDAFIVVHGTDTLAYTASMLAFMFENLSKPIVVTGSMIPLYNLKNDAQNNLLVSLMTASMHKIPEVVVVFDNKVLRGCRSTKVNANAVDAFASPNYPILGKAGKKVEIDMKRVLQPPQGPMSLRLINPKSKVVVIKLFPGITKKYLDSIINNNIVHGIVLETFGIGDAPSSESFIEAIEYILKRGIVVVNVSQCLIHQVDQKDYATGVMLHDLGVISGYDMTTEAAVAKLYFLFGNVKDQKLYPQLMTVDMRGEIITARDTLPLQANVGQ